MKKIIFFVVIVLNQVSGAEFLIGPEKNYTTPNAFYKAVESGQVILLQGDTISIEAGIYRGIDVLAIWREDNLLIRGINGRANLYAEGQYIIGKGIFVSEGDDIRYESIGFFDAAVPDKNGAGIRLDGAGLVVRNCYFFNNENGILANDSENGRVIIESSEFAAGGAGDGFSHNIYINHCASLTIRYCYFHEASVGHQIKSRADSTMVLYSKVMDLDGNSSRLIDVSNGGFCLLLGNELVQGQNAENNNLIGYGLEGLTNPAPHSLRVVHNTILNRRNNSCRFLHVAQNIDEFELMNNIFGGICILVDGPIPVASGNLIEENMEELKFESLDSNNFLITAGSSAIDHGEAIVDQSHEPSLEYSHPLSFVIREKIGKPDAGAHEAQIVVKTKEDRLFAPIIVNPVADFIEFKSDSDLSFQIYNLNGVEVLNGLSHNNRIEVTSLLTGIYILSVQNHLPTKLIKL